MSIEDNPPLAQAWTHVYQLLYVAGDMSFSARLPHKTDWQNSKNGLHQSSKTTRSISERTNDTRSDEETNQQRNGHNYAAF